MESAEQTGEGRWHMVILRKAQSFVNLDLLIFVSLV
jgi:hypothetical protein